MLKLLQHFLAILLVAVLNFSVISTNNHADYRAENMVYICKSEGAYAYHLTNKCRGLSNCKHDIIQDSITEAYKLGKNKLCGWED